jgi:4-hydroxythreonine-4-phosphate dehydrogenase
MTSDDQITIALSIGDPAGIGPEVVLKALTDPEIVSLAHWIVVGEHAVLRQAGETCGIPLCELSHVVLLEPAALPGSAPVRFGELNADYGRAAALYVQEATQLCMTGKADAMVTAPLNKEAVTSSGMSFLGHTEYIAQLCGAMEVRMLLASEKLKVIHVTTHVSLRQSTESTAERILRTIELGNEGLGLLGIERPRIAVAGLNPHAGEHGLFGTEDATNIAPAVREAQARGLDCIGPIAPDTVFLKAYRGGYDLVVAMYHDQGHIPMKLIAFEETVNVSLGLPIIRTSVDHGTAFDIAGKNQADARNMKAALRMAVSMARRKRLHGSKSAGRRLAR